MDIQNSLLRRLRRSIASLSLVTLLAGFTVIAPSAAATTAQTAADADEYYSNAFDYMIDQGLVSASANFDLADSMPRDEFVYYVMETFYPGEADAAEAAGTLPANPFTDVTASNEYLNQILMAYDMGIVTGDTDSEGDSTGKFRPEDGMNRVEIPAVIFRALDMSAEGPEDYTFFQDADANEWYTSSMNSALGYGLMMGDTDTEGDLTADFRPADDMNYAEAFTILYRATGEGTGSLPLVDMDFDGLTDAEEEDLGTDPAMEDTDGDGWLDGVEVYVKGTDPKVVTPTGDGTMMIEVVDMDDDTVPTGAMGVTVMGLEVTAMGGDMTLNNLEVTREGVGSNADIEAVYIYEGSQRLTNGRTLNSTTNSVEFTGLGIDVPEGETVTVYVRVDFTTGADAASEHMFTVSSGDMTASGGEIEADFPLEGPTYTVSGTAAAEVTIEDTGSLSDVTMGDETAEIGMFNIAANNEDVSIQEISLTVDGTVSTAALTDLKLMNDGEVVAEAEGVNEDDMVVFDLGSSAVSIDEGDDTDFTVTAKVGSAADPDDTVSLYLDEESDLLALGLVTGYGARVTNGYTTSDTETVTIQGGELTIADNGPSSQDFVVGEEDAMVMELAFTAERDLELQYLAINLTATGDGLEDADGDANFSNVRIESDNGYSYTEDLPNDAGDDNTEDITFDTGIMIPAGETVTLNVYVDIENNADLDGDTIKAVFNTGVIEFEDVDSGADENELTVVPSSAIEGNVHHIQSASLTFSSSATVPTANSIVARTDKAPLFAFVVEPGEASDVTVNTLTAQVLYNTTDPSTEAAWGYNGTSTTDSYVVENVVSTLYLYDEDDALLDSCNVESDGSCQFDSIDTTISAADNVLWTVKGDITSNAPQDDADGDFVAVNFSDIDAEDEQGEDVSVQTIDDVAVNGQDAVVAPPVYQILVAGGSLTLKAPASQADDMLVLAGTPSDTDVDVGSATFRAEDEDYEINSLQISLVNASAADSLTSMTLSYEGLDSDGDVVMATVSKPVSGQTTNFQTFSTDWIVEKGGSEDFEISYNTNPHSVDDGGADTMDNMQWRLADADATLDATGLSSDDDTLGAAALSTAVTGPNLYLVNTMPVIEINESKIDDDLSNGDTDVFAIDVTAEGNGSGAVGVAGFTLDVDFDNLTETDEINLGTNWSVYDASDMTSAIPATITIVDDGDDTDDTGSQTVTVSFTDAEQIAVGTTETFVVRLDVAIADSLVDSYIKLKMQEDAAVTLNDATDLLNDPKYFVWTDVANTGTDISGDGDDIETDLNDAAELGFLSGFGTGLPTSQVYIEKTH